MQDSDDSKQIFESIKIMGICILFLLLIFSIIQLGIYFYGTYTSN